MSEVTVTQADREFLSRILIAFGLPTRACAVRMGGDVVAVREAMVYVRSDRIAHSATPSVDGEVDALRSSIRALRSVLQSIANDEGDTTVGRRCLAAIGKSRVSPSLSPRPLPTREEVELPHHTSISLDDALAVVRAGDMHRWSGAIYDHLRNYAALLNREAQSCQTM